jgi:hypothetical protein
MARNPNEYTTLRATLSAPPPPAQSSCVLCTHLASVASTQLYHETTGRKAHEYAKQRNSTGHKSQLTTRFASASSCAVLVSPGGAERRRRSQ